MSRTAHRLFSSSLRQSARASSITAAHSSRPALTRRMMSSDSHANHGSVRSDKLWIIGSALVFGPLFLYLLSPSARKGSEHAHMEHSHQNQHGKHVQHVEAHREEDTVPVTDDEGTEVPVEEVKESVEKALETDSPKDAQEHEEVVTEAESPTDVDSQTEPSTDSQSTPESVSNPDRSNMVGDDEAQGTRSEGEESAPKSAESKA